MLNLGSVRCSILEFCGAIDLAICNGGLPRIHVPWAYLWHLRLAFCQRLVSKICCAFPVGKRSRHSLLVDGKTQLAHFLKSAVTTAKNMGKYMRNSLEDGFH